jgi:flagellar biosynthetic protein FliR
LIDSYNSNYILFLLVFTRISGAVLFNPFLGRKNVPVITKIGLSLIIAIGVFPSLGYTSTGIDSFVVFVFVIFKELLVGFTTGFLMQLAMSSVLIAGETVDMQLGLGMSKIYDPASNISMALTGTIYNLLFTLVFFLSNGHLTLIRLLVETCRLFKVGSGFINPEAGGYIVLIFGDILLLSLKLAMPVIAVELLTEAGLGFLMRSVSHINIFSVSLQIKLALGLFMVILALPVTSKVLDFSITYMFDKIKNSLSNMLAS